MNVKTIGALLLVLSLMLSIGCSLRDADADGDALDTKYPFFTDKDGAVITGGDQRPVVSDSGTAAEDSESTQSGNEPVTGGAVTQTPEGDVQETVTVAPPAGTTAEEGTLIYNKDGAIIYVDHLGTTYINGHVATPDDVDKVVEDKVPVSDVIAEIIDGEDEPEVSVTTPPPVTTPAVSTTTTTATATTEKEPVVTDEKDPPVNELETLGKYIDTGDTALDVTQVSLLSNSSPGVSGLVNYNAGELLLINYRCNTAVALDSNIYLVPSDAAHKGEFARGEYTAAVMVYQSFATGDGKFFSELQIPAGIPAGRYDIRFCYRGVEEGYVTIIIE